MNDHTHPAKARWLDHLVRDVRHACRMLARSPGLTVLVVASLGIGIGVNVAVFSWIQALAFRPLPGVPDAGRFLIIDVVTAEGQAAGSSWPEYGDLGRGLRSFDDVIAYRMVPFTVGEARGFERAYGMLVSDNYFSGLGIRPAAGRFPDSTEAAGGAALPVVVISWELAHGKFGGPGGAPGSTIVVNDRPLTVIGVTPRGFQGTVLGLAFDMWVPATLAPLLLQGSRELEAREVRGYWLMGRLAESSSRERAQLEVDAAMQRLAETYPATNANIGARVLTFWDAPRGPQRLFVRALGILQGVMLLLLLAVCGNIASLVLARASTRRREMGIRLALGAGRLRIAALLLTENVVLALAGAALGTAIALWSTRLLSAIPISGALPIRLQAGVDVVGLALAVALGIACGIAVGVGPAVQLSRMAPDRALRGTSDVVGRNALRNILMGAEVALAVVVLLVAALFFRSFADTRTTDPGFERDGVLLAAYDLTGRGRSPAAQRMLAATLLERFRALPSVEAAAVATWIPLDIHGLPVRPFMLEGNPRTDGTLDVAVTNTVTPGYFETMKIPLRAGSDFVALTNVAAPPQAIVNEEFVRRFIGNADPLGRRIESSGRTFTIVGVVRNSLYDAFGEAPKPAMFLSYRDRPGNVAQIHLRTRAGTEMLLARDVRRIVAELEPSLPVYDVRTLEDHVERNLFLRRIPARLFSVLGPLLLALAAGGIYAVVAYSVAQRRNEIGLRLALGATPRRVTLQFVEESLAVIGIGLLAGWIITFAIHRQMSNEPVDFLTFGGVPLLLLIVATLAAWLPARRATQADPLVALRHD